MNTTPITSWRGYTLDQFVRANQHVTLTEAVQLFYRMMDLPL